MKTSNMKSLLDNLGKALKERHISNSQPLEPLSLMGGKLGMALFAAYYYEVGKKQEFLDFAVTTIEECFEHISNQEAVADTFCSGICGVAWVVNHFIQKGWIEEDESPLLQFDEYLEDVGIGYFQQGYYDYLHGGIGIALYWLERESGEEHLKTMLRLLEEQAIQDERGIHWQNMNLGLLYKDNVLKKEVNFSLSHGMTSIIYILTKVHEKGIEKELCEKLLRGVIQFIQHFPCETDEPAAFPSSLEIDEKGEYKKTNPSRLAWCYGDLGMSVVMMQTGLQLKDENILNFAKEIGLKTLQRKTMEDSQLRDAGFCHGVFGVAFCYEKMFEYSKAPQFLEAANHWFEIGNKYLTDENPIAQYHSLDSEDIPIEDTILSGSTGIGLVIMEKLGLLKKTEGIQHWDRVLLLS